MQTDTHHKDTKLKVIMYKQSNIFKSPKFYETKKNSLKTPNSFSVGHPSLGMRPTFKCDLYTE